MTDPWEIGSPETPEIPRGCAWTVVAILAGSAIASVSCVLGVLWWFTS